MSHWKLHSTSINVVFLWLHLFLESFSSTIIHRMHTNCVLESFGKGLVIVFAAAAHLQTRPQYSSPPWCRTPHTWGCWVVRVGQISSNDNHSPVLLCLLDVLKVGLALIGNGNSGGLKIRVQVSTYPLHCPQLTMVDFFGLSLVFYLGWLPTSALQLAANYFEGRRLCACATSPAGIVMSYTDNGTALGLARVRENSSFSTADWDYYELFFQSR